MTAGYIDLFLDQGATFNTAITLTDVNGNALNLANYQVSSKVKKSYITSNVAATFIITVANNLSGMINLSLPYQVTQNLRPQRYVYDVIIKDASNTASRVLEGTVYVDAGVTSSP